MREDKTKQKVKDICTRDLVISLPEANREDVAGIACGVGEVDFKRHSVGLNKSTCETKAQQREIPCKETSLSGDKRKGTAPWSGTENGKQIG